MPIRERAVENKNLFEISEDELIEKISSLKKYENINKAFYKPQSELEKSFVVLPNGKVIRTENGIDVYKGNAFIGKVTIFNNERISKKIKTFVATYRICN